MPTCTIPSTLTTQRLVLEPVEEARLEALLGGAYSLIFDAPVADGIEAFTGEMVWSLRRLRRAAEAERAWWTPFLFLEQTEGMVVGFGGLKGPPGGGAVEIGYSVADSVCGRGFATEAVSAMCAHAFTQPGVRIIRAHALDANKASARVLEKCGFVRAGEPREAKTGRMQRWERQKE
jgi:[ribosomal protein S5]-alanine N-acetyltransferase